MSDDKLREILVHQYWRGYELDQLYVDLRALIRSHEEAVRERAMRILREQQKVCCNTQDSQCHEALAKLISKMPLPSDEEKP